MRSQRQHIVILILVHTSMSCWIIFNWCNGVFNKRPPFMAMIPFRARSPHPGAPISTTGAGPLGPCCLSLTTFNKWIFNIMREASMLLFLGIFAFFIIISKTDICRCYRPICISSRDNMFWYVVTKGVKRDIVYRSKNSSTNFRCLLFWYCVGYLVYFETKILKLNDTHITINGLI